MDDYVSGDIFVRRPIPQTLKAWKPLWDCVDILFEFQNSDVDEERTEWRIYWVAGIALLRTVGHVLAKSDAILSNMHSNAIDAAWNDWRNDRERNAIFWNFIEKERNNILKTYDFGATLAQDENGYFVQFEDGSDAFQLFRKAVYWWRHQLEVIESCILR